MEGQRSRLEGFCIKLAGGLALLILAYLLIVSVLGTVRIDAKEHAVFEADAPLLHLLLWALFAALLGKIGGRLARASGRGLLLGLLIFVLAVGNWLVFAWKVEPVADQGTVLSAAQAFAKGDYTMLDAGGYLAVYPHQLGLVAYFQLLNAFAGPNTYLLIQVCNVFALMACYYLLYRITRQLFGAGNVSVLCILLLFGCIQPLFYVSFAYGNLVGLAAALGAIYFQLRYFAERKRSLALLSAGLIALSIALRSNHLVFLIAMAIFYLADAIFEKKRFSYCMVLLVFLANVLLAGLVNLSYHLASGREITKGMPKVLWIAMGMQEGERASGWYNEYSLALYRKTGCDDDAARQQAQKDIAARLEAFAERPGEAAAFYYRKTASMWNNPDYQAFWVNLDNRPSNIWGSPLGQSLFQGEASSALGGYMNIYQSIIFLGALLFFLLSWKKNCLRQMILAVVFLGGFLFHLFWEAKGQYALPYFLLLLPYASAGWMRFLEAVQHKFSAVLQNPQKTVKNGIKNA